MQTSFFNEDFLSSLSTDKFNGLMMICQKFFELQSLANNQLNFLEDYLAAIAVFAAYADNHQYEYKLPDPNENTQETLQSIVTFFAKHRNIINKILTSTELEFQKQKYQALLDKNAEYKFSNEDYDKVQLLINEMRDLIRNSETIPDKHKARLLERLEKMQRELNKKTSTLDGFFAFIGEAGITLGQFGEDVKPIVDRLKEIMSIVKDVISIKNKLLTFGINGELANKEDQVKDLD